MRRNPDIGLMVGGQRNTKRTVALALALLLAGCGSSADHNPSPDAKAKPVLESVQVQPDFTKLSPDGKHCEDGATRPCFQPIYKTPRFERPLTVGLVLNAVNYKPGTRIVESVAGPYEPYKGNPGDELTVVCQGKNESNELYNVVKISVSKGNKNHAINGKAYAEATGPSPLFGVAPGIAGMIAVYGYALAKWDHAVGETSTRIYTELPHCNSDQDPKGLLEPAY